MMRTGSRFNRFVRALGCAAVVAGSTSSPLQAETPSKSRTPRNQVTLASYITGETSESMAQIAGMIEDAMQDRAIDASERRLILRQAERVLSSVEVAEVEARLNALPIARPIDDVKQAPVSNHSNGNDAAAGLSGGIQSCTEEPGGCGVCDNMNIFTAFDAWKGPIDDDSNNNFGIRTGFNWGVPLWAERGIGFQFGMSYGGYDFHGRDSASVTETSSIEDQLFFTTGLFHRSNMTGIPCTQDRISWGLVYDFMVTDNAGEGADEWHFSQFRGQLGYACDCNDEVGLMFSLGIGPDQSASDGVAASDAGVDVMNQASVFWHHKWCWAADTRLYTGIAEEVGEWVLGANGEVPISLSVSLFGGAQYIMPSSSGGAMNDRFAEEVWNVSAGVAYYPGGNAVSKTVSGRRWMPLLPVADNGSFVLDADPGKF